MGVSPPRSEHESAQSSGKGSRGAEPVTDVTGERRRRRGTRTRRRTGTRTTRRRGTRTVDSIHVSVSKHNFEFEVFMMI